MDKRIFLYQVCNMKLKPTFGLKNTGKHWQLVYVQVYSNSNFFGYISNRPKKLCNDFFWGTEDLILVQLTLIIQKISKKVDFCHFFRDVLSLGWGGMGVLWCNRLNYSLQMGQIWPIMTQNDWLWPRMTYQGSWGHQGVQGGTRGRQGGPGYPRRQKEW